MENTKITFQIKTLARCSYSLNWDWFSVFSGLGVRFLNKNISLAKDSPEECKHVGECFPWMWFGQGKVKWNAEQGTDEDNKLSEEVSKYMGSEDSKSTEDEPVLHPPVHSTCRPGCGHVKYCPTLLRLYGQNV